MATRGWEWEESLLKRDTIVERGGASKEIEVGKSIGKMVNG